MIDNTFVMYSILEKFNNDLEEFEQHSKRIATAEGYISSCINKLTMLLSTDKVTLEQLQNLEEMIASLKTASNEYSYIKGIEDGIKLLSFLAPNNAIPNLQRLLDDTGDNFTLNELRNHTKLD